MSIFEQIAASGFEMVDLIIVLAYLAILIFLGLFLGRSKKGEEKSANDYFLAGNTLTWWAVGASLIAANISAEQFIGMSGTSYADGIATAAYELMAAVTLVVIGKFLLPVMLKRKISRFLSSFVSVTTMVWDLRSPSSGSSCMSL